MYMSHLPGLRTRSLLALLASTAVLATGCSTSMSSGSNSSLDAARPGTVAGRVHGGNQAVSGATVTLYFAGRSGLGGGLSTNPAFVPTVAAAHTITASTGSGGFSFTKKTTAASGDNANADNTFSCPTASNAANPYVYVVARGGNTVGTGTSDSNADAVFLAPVGRCEDISASTFINMSEVVTVATMAAVHQFIDPTLVQGQGVEATISSDNNFVGPNALNNAFDSVSNLADPQTGLAVASIVRSSTSGSAAGVTVTLTPETAKINHLANVISSCINNLNTGSQNCQTLYGAAVPVTSSATTGVPGATQQSTPADVLVALYNIFTNPTNGSTANLQTIYGLSGSGAPYGTGLTTPPSDWTVGIQYAVTGTCAGTTAAFVGTPAEIASDVNENIWVTNQNSGAGGVAQISPFGVPQNCFATVVAGTPVTATGLAIDAAGNAWVGSQTTNDIFRFAPTGSTTSPGSLDITTPTPVVSIAADGFGNVYYTTNDGRLVELSGASTTTNPTPVAAEISTAPQGAGIRLSIAPAATGAGGAYTDYSLFAASSANFFSVTTSSGGSAGPPPTAPTGFRTVSPNTGNLTVGLAPYGTSRLGAVALSFPSLNQVGLETSNGDGTYTASASAATAGGLNSPVALSLDGSGNIWAANSSGNGVSELDSSLNALSPSTGFVKSSGYIASSAAITVDAGGNVWLGVSTNTVTEIVGAAVPVFQPAAAALASGRFQALP